MIFIFTYPLWNPEFIAADLYKYVCMGVFAYVVYLGRCKSYGLLKSLTIRLWFLASKDNNKKLTRS